MFCVLVYKTIEWIIGRIAIVSGVPISYALTPHHTFDWFFFPASLIMLLSLIMLIGAITTMLIGKHISKTPGNLVIGILMYVTFYTIVAPMWLIRSMYDLLTGTRRSWR
jgi:hypothetical protein